MKSLTLAQLRVLDAVVAEGSLQAAATRLGRSHPTLHTALNNMEQSLGFKILDRSGYRLALTTEGEAFLARARRVLHEMEELQAFARQVAAGEESDLRIVIGDLSPLSAMLEFLGDFFSHHPRTRPHLRFETLSAPWRLLESDAVDLILHHVMDGDARFETLPLGRVTLIPVAAPGFLPFPVEEATVDRMRDLVQCVIRDSATVPEPRTYFVIDGARVYSVSDQMMKREVILRGLAWGHMPDYLVTEDLANGALVPINNSYFHGGTVNLVAARKAGSTHGPIARALWAMLKTKASTADFRVSLGPREESSR